MCDEGEKTHDDPTSPLEDSLGHKIYNGTTYVRGRYLEFDSMNNKCHADKISKAKVLVAVESIFFPYVPVHREGGGRGARERAGGGGGVVGGPVLATTKTNIKIFNEIIIERQVKSDLFVLRM